jgi:hypothetical protein
LAERETPPETLRGFRNDEYSQSIPLPSNLPVPFSNLSAPFGRKWPVLAAIGRFKGDFLEIQ